MLRWLKRKSNNYAVSVAQKEFEQVLLMLRGMDDSEVAMIVAGALTMKTNLRRMGEPIDEMLDHGLSSDQERGLFLGKLHQIIKFYQEEKMPATAAGVMVWMHSIRALVYPETRILGRSLWEELSRGFDDAIENFYFANASKADEYPEEEVEWELEHIIPPGLIPRS